MRDSSLVTSNDAEQSPTYTLDDTNAITIGSASVFDSNAENSSGDDIQINGSKKRRRRTRSSISS
jgi:hypothetical protein